MQHGNSQAFLEELADLRHDLPFSPDVVQKLFLQTGEEAMVSLNEVAATIGRDQGLATKVLSMANSAFYGLQSQVTSILRAVNVLGLKEIRNIVLVLGVKALSRKRRFPPGFDPAAYWKHQLAVAVMAKALARLGGEADPDDLFTAGLLHDLGKLLTALRRPDDWLAIARIAREKNLPWREAEDLYWGLDHGVIGALALRSWDLPSALSEPVNWHHSPRVAPERRAESLLLRLADVLAQADPSGEVLPEEAVELAAALSLDPAKAVEAAREAATAESMDEFVSLLA